MADNKPIKAEQVLKIEPRTELHFRGPYTEIATEYLILTNPSDRKVCFKIKTTAPKRYCVRPNSGIIDPKNSTKIAVMLQPSLSVDSQQINEFKNKHKFMVQTTFAPDGEVNQESLWKKVDPLSIMESKLKCVFDLHYIEVNENQDNNKDHLSSSPTLTPSLANTKVDELFSTNEQSLGSNVYVKPSEDTNSVTLVEDNRKLRDEVALLRQELMQVKEEGLKKRINKPQAQGPTYGGDLLENQQNTDQVVLKDDTHILFLALFFFVLGVIFSKILL